MGSAFCTASQYPLKSVSRGGFNFGIACFAFATTCKVACLPLTDPTPLRADGDFYARAFDGSVALPIARYDYGGGWAPPPTGLAPAGTSTSLAAAPLPSFSQRDRSPSENCFLKAGSAAENRIVTQPVKVHPMKLGAGFPEPSPQLYKWPFLGVSSSIHSRADVTSECCASDKPEPTRLAPSANHAREIAGSRALV
jgi:hypothetical protein